ncbi:MAG: hypothetical protein WDA47_01675 [Bacilli bacterium]
MRNQVYEYLKKMANEESSYTLKLTFTDEDGELVDPVTLLWTLTTEDGTVVNNRYKIAVGEPTSITYITLHGSDLQLVDKRNIFETRVFTLEGTYNSTFGNALPIKQQVFFRIRNIILIALPIGITVEDNIFTSDYVERVSA